MNWMKYIEIDFCYYRFDFIYNFYESIYNNLDKYRKSDILILSIIIDIKLLYKIIYLFNRWNDYIL